MKDALSRLRAVLTPQAVLAVAAALLLFYAAAGTHRSGETDLETRIAQTLSQVEGAGRVHVTIRTREVKSGGGVLSPGQAEAVPCGAVAVAQGADDPLVALAITDALCALLGLPGAAVNVAAGGR